LASIIGKRRVAAGAVQHRRHDAGVDEAMLLGEGGFVRHCQLDFARGEPRDFDTKRLHHALPGKARAHPIGEIRILRLKRHRAIPFESNSDMNYSFRCRRFKRFCRGSIKFIHR
jgi:hypothetical protein